MEANKIRKLYLDFFKSKGHKIIESAPIVVKNDPTLMFVNAGMNQFKDVFLGDTIPKNTRIANSQKCLRVSGKHNDLEEVGHDTYHHTMFEMLGSWSFGDYFKKEAIDWAWEFLVDVCKLEKERLYVTVFEGSNNENLEKDNEAFNFWKRYLSEDKILNGNKKDNFWEMGDVGPCGPCSEIHYDNRTNIEREKISGSTLVNKDHPQVIEIWNLVFIQYNRSSDGNLHSLPNNHVDTGMGFERLAMIMQGVTSNYDTDIFQSIIKAIALKACKNYGNNDKQDIAMRVIADHLRAVVFSIADGQLPSNVKAGYVIRRILRRAIRYAYTFLNLKNPFMYQLVEVLIKHMGEHFINLKSQQDLIAKVVKEEEDSFLRTLSDGLKRIEQITKDVSDQVSGQEVFELYDTYGFPVDLTELILVEKGIGFNKAEFDFAMTKQKERSKKAGRLETGDWTVLIEDEHKSNEFAGYKKLEKKVRITRYREVHSNDGKKYQLVFDLTPFYAEGGGQVGDTGTITNLNETIAIVDTKKENKLIIHYVEKLPKDLLANFNAKVNLEKRKAIERNHSATHLLHETLISILGDHVVQKGSLVNSTYLRFDFSHFTKITKSDLEKIEKDVNSKIIANIPVNEHVSLSLDKAKKLGAIMLFGEKYEDVVRMIQFDKSKELCGGTHVNSTGEIGLFKILSEGSISSGIRRIEGKTGDRALDYLNQKESLLKEIEILVKNKDLKTGVKKIIDTNKKLEKQLLDFKNLNLGKIKNQLLESAVEIKGIRFIAKELEMEADDIKNISFQLRKEKNLAMVIAAKSKEKALLSVFLTDDLVSSGMSAVVMIKELAKEINGDGGGQAFFATAGGENLSGINNALEKAKKLL